MASFNRAKMCVIYSPSFSRAKQIIFYNTCIESSFTYVIYMITCANWFHQRATYLRSQKKKKNPVRKFLPSLLLENVLQECLLFVCKTKIDLSLREIILAFDINASMSKTTKRRTSPVWRDRGKVFSVVTAITNEGIFSFVTN